MPYIKRKEWKAIEEELEAYRNHECGASGAIAAAEVTPRGRGESENAQLKKQIKADAKMFDVHEDLIPVVMETPPLLHAKHNGQQGLNMVDGKYRVVSKTVFDEVLLNTKVDSIEWLEDVQDCDDISLLFVARCVRLGLNSVGRIMSWGGGHCFNLVIARDENDKPKFYYLEAQTDQWIEEEDLKGMYSMENALIVI